MRLSYKFILTTIAAAAIVFSSCVAQIDDEPEVPARGVPAVAEATIHGKGIDATRANLSADNGWTVSSFSLGDKAGFYAQSGVQNPDDPDDFSFGAVNGEMFFEGISNGNYRFGNSEVVIDPIKVTEQYTYMYYPYYKDMPDPAETGTPPGMPLQQLDENDGIVKCVDFMRLYSSKVNLTNGIMKPDFRHNGTQIVILRGDGFMNAEDRRIWIVMKNPSTDVRITQAANGSYNTVCQYNPPEGEDPMIYLVPGASTFKVNKYAVWEAWEGATYINKEAKYVLVPPGQTYFIYIQDDFGNWHTVTNYTLGSSQYKTAYSGERNRLTISLVGLDVTVRPVAIAQWDEEESITDTRKVGITEFSEYISWATAYNSYIDGNRDESMYEELMKYGDGSYNPTTGYTSWTFYINADIEFKGTEFAQVKRLDDTLEGSSTYTNYQVRNIGGTLIEEMGPSGVLRALDFPDIYLMQPKSDDSSFGAIVGVMNGGTIEKCHISNAVVIANNAVGMLAGSVTNGTVKDCSVSGDVIGTSTAAGFNGLFGTASGTPVVENTTTKGLTFIQN